MSIKLINPFRDNDALRFTNEGLTNDNGLVVFPNIAGAFRVLATSNNYTDNFGFQWNKFVKTQIDNKESEISKVRLFAETNWDKEDLTNKNVLEVGSGAGRFSEVILNHTSANLYSVDYSNAVEANDKNNGHHGSKFKLFQASIYDMPFAPNQFDKVICIGVLQHTPDFKASIKSLVNQLKPGGELVVDFYPIKGWWTKICAKYIFRPITKKWNHEKLLNKIEKNIDWMISLSHFFYKIKLGFLNRFIPICGIYGALPINNLTKAQLRDWCILDTFDMFSPEHDHPQKLNTVEKWVKEYGMEISFAKFINFNDLEAPVIRAVKK